MWRLEKTLFLCTNQRWGNENKMEWMQGLREPCPACADESQSPDLIHTPEQKLTHASRKVLVHAGKVLSLLKPLKTFFSGILRHVTNQVASSTDLTAAPRSRGHLNCTSEFNLEEEWWTIVRTRAHVSATMVTMVNLACVFYAWGWCSGLFWGVCMLYLRYRVQVPPTVHKHAPWILRWTGKTASHQWEWTHPKKSKMSLKYSTTGNICW